MQYMALIYADENGWATLSDEEREAWYERYRAFSEDARAAGVMVGGSELGATRDATTVRVRDGETLITDGPYAEVKEALGGYYLLECDTIGRDRHVVNAFIQIPLRVSSTTRHCC